MAKLPIWARRTGLAMAFAGGLAAGVGAALRLLDPAPSALAAASEVAISGFRFGPTALTVAAGTKVVWTNRDDDPHTVTSEADPKQFNSPPLDTGESFSVSFDKPGTYRYFCSIHPHMQGTVVVR